MVMRDVGLATGSWARWVRDILLAEILGIALASMAVGAVVGEARIWPRGWWMPVAIAAMLAVVLLSFILPVVIEPLFNTFTPLPAGELRGALLDLAHRDGVPVKDVLVADASKRTSALNAYVSGLGPTRRIVVNDTLIDRGKDDEVVAVVAHELGHVVARDVLFGTLAGACASALAVFAVAIMLQSPAVLSWGHATGASDPAVAGLLITLTVWISFLASPLTNGVSRRIERQADQHSFDLIEDQQAMVRMHQSLAVHNLATLAPKPLRYLWFASHPTSPERIKAARLHAIHAARVNPVSGW
jgi:STE24 endopeptidase